MSKPDPYPKFVDMFMVYQDTMNDLLGATRSIFTAKPNEDISQFQKAQHEARLKMTILVSDLWQRAEKSN